MEMFSKGWGRLFGEKNSAGKNPTGVLDFPGGPEVKSLPCNAGDVGLIPGLGGSHVPQAAGHVYGSTWTLGPTHHN